MNDRVPTPLPPDLESLVPAVPFSRRGFLVSSVASGFALTAGPLMAQTMIVTDTKGLVAGDVKIPTAGGDMPGYYAAPAKSGKFPVILVVGEIWAPTSTSRTYAGGWRRLDTSLSPTSLTGRSASSGR